MMEHAVDVVVFFSAVYLRGQTLDGYAREMQFTAVVFVQRNTRLPDAGRCYTSFSVVPVLLRPLWWKPRAWKISRGIQGAS